MPKTSRKGQLMPESPIRKLVPYAEEAKRKGKKVFHLNIGQPDIQTPEVVIEAMRNYNPKVIEYTHSAGNESYRRGLAEYYKKVGINVDYSDILITTGGSEALSFGFQTCFGSDAEVIIPEPFYANYNGFCVSAGVSINPIVATIDNGFALPSIKNFERQITRRTRGILICNPGNPTGTLYTKEELQDLRDLVKKYDLFLFADEVYREFCYDGKEHHSVMNLQGIEDNVVMIDSVSKRYSMCGVRIGCMVSRNQEVINTALKFAQARLSPPAFGQIASEAALKTPESYFERVITEYSERRDVLIDGLNSIEGVKCPKPSGAFYAIAELPVDNAEKFCQWLLEDFDYNGETVMLAPASGFYSILNRGTKEVRLAYVLNKDALLEALEVLREALRVYPGSTVKAKKAQTSGT